MLFMKEEKEQHITYEQFDPWSDHPETILSNVKMFFKCLWNVLIKMCRRRNITMDDFRELMFTLARYL